MKNWIIETFRRFQQPGSPYFKYWGKINLFLMVLAGLPTILIWVDTFFEINTFDNTVPHPYWIRILLKVLFGAATWGKIISSSSIKNSHDIIQDQDILIQQPKKDLPYTAQKQGAAIVAPINQ